MSNIYLRDLLEVNNHDSSFMRFIDKDKKIDNATFDILKRSTELRGSEVTPIVRIKRRVDLSMVG